VLKFSYLSESGSGSLKDDMSRSGYVFLRKRQQALFPFQPSKVLFVLLLFSKALSQTLVESAVIPPLCLFLSHAHLFELCESRSFSRSCFDVLVLSIYVGHDVSGLASVGFTRRKSEGVGVLGGVVSALGAGYVLPTARHYRVVTVLGVSPYREPAPAVVTSHSEFQDFSGEIFPNYSFLRIETDAFC